MPMNHLGAAAGRSRRCPVCVLLCLVSVAPAAAWQDRGIDANGPYDPHGGLLLHGQYVMNVGELRVNITNWGLIGSEYSRLASYSEAASAQWPAGSQDEYLFGAGLWVGGVLLGERLVSTGYPAREILSRPEVPEDTIYEAIRGRLVRPVGNDEASGRRVPEPEPNDDEDVDDSGRPRIDEETLNGFDDDGDGRIDEDFGQLGNQMLVTTMFDNTRLAQEENADHTPLGLEVVQEAMAWENDQADDFVGFQYTVKNTGIADIDNVYIGFYADSDIAPRGLVDGAEDDLVGSFSGSVRTTDGGWVPVEVAYMYDAAVVDPLPGYFGIAFLSHDVDPEGLDAPQRVALRSFQSFSRQAPFEDGGDPVNDAQRYELLSRAERDPDAQRDREADFRFVVSAGPFAVLEPDATLRFQVAMAVGEGLDGLLATCGEAALTWYGNYLDLMPDEVSRSGLPVVTGELGRESMVCREDFANPTLFDQIRPDFGDASCIAADYLLAQPPLTDDDIFDHHDPVTGERRTCAMVNLDNCFECFRLKPHRDGETAEEAACDQADVEAYWTCNRPGGATVACTGIDGNETQVSWLVGMAPPPPGLRVWPAASRVHVFWDDLSENTPDVRSNAIDFEAYRVWRADNWTRPYGSSLTGGPESNLWQLIAEYDVVDSMRVAHVVAPQETLWTELPLGRNTGLAAIRYVPAILDDPRFAGLAEATQQVIDSRPLDPALTRPPLYDANGVPVEDLLPLAPWQGYPAALDTFWAVAARAARDTVIDGQPVVLAVAKAPVQYYEYVDQGVHNGFIYFYSVTATDHELASGRATPVITGPGQAGDPSSSFVHTSPAKRAQSADERAAQGANIFAYPNPATREALSSFQQLLPNGDDPTGVRVNFANLPQARSTIEIYTLAGDLVQTIEHDGSGGVGEASWNLMSRNGQEVVSGIYLFVVHAADDRFDDVIGKFVVVR